MKCPNCGVEVERGTIFCPDCLTEIPWVPEYNTLETLMTKEKSKQDNTKGHRGKGHRKKQRKPAARVVMILGICVVLVLLVKFYVDYRNYHSFDYQYENAMSFFENGRFQQAEDAMERALELEPEAVEANVLNAKILYHLGDRESAVSILEALLVKNPSSIEVYGGLIWLYEEQEDLTSIQKLLTACQQENVLEAFGEYLVEEPVASKETGVYDDLLLVELSSEEGKKIYYTVDGTDPTKDSALYTMPISMKEGVTELKAVCINEKGIPSDIVYRKYTVVIKGPDMPEITPAAGQYSEPVKITMEVPEGCKGYYAFDDPQVSTVSQEYTGPVEMPVGNHVFYGILVAANGKESETASVGYQYEPAAKGTNAEGES